MLLATLDPKLELLLAGYVRGAEGAAEVLHDALLERRLEPLPIVDDKNERLERVLALLSAVVLTRIGCASARRVIGRFTKEVPNEPALENALVAVERSNDGTKSSPDAIRQAVFHAWRECGRRGKSPEAARVAWAVWMLMRDMPLVALRSVRAIDAAELGAQIDLVARALGAA